MKKLLDDPDHFVDDFLAGIVAAHPEVVLHESDGRVLLRRAAPDRPRVGIVTGGGSGHLPLFLGYVGAGLCSGCAVGNVFSSPSAATVTTAAQAVDSGLGVLFLYGNYGGDLLVFDEASEDLRDAGHNVETVVVTDDVASAAAESASSRRGVAGMIFAFRTAGAAAELGWSLAEVAQVARRTVARTRTMGVGLSPTTLPTTGQPTFEIGDDEMEVGIGIHGERGRSRTALRPAAAVTQLLLEPILAELDVSRVAVILNSLGSTSQEELYVLYGHVVRILGERNIAIARSSVGRFATSMEMAGASISILALDAELEALLANPASSPLLGEL